MRVCDVLGFGGSRGGVSLVWWGRSHGCSAGTCGGVLLVCVVYFSAVADVEALYLALCESVVSVFVIDMWTLKFQGDCFRSSQQSQVVMKGRLPVNPRLFRLRASAD